MSQNFKLFALAYGGGTASIIYHKWKNLLPPSIELIPVDYPKRGKRLKEPFYQTLNEAIQDLSHQILAQITKDDSYAILGHSMGALLSYEICAHHIKINAPLPQSLFLSGKNCPLHNEIETISHLDEAAFIQKIVNLDGIPKEVLENKALMDYFLPIIRTDYHIFESYQWQDHPTLQVPFYLFFGLNDPMMHSAGITQWHKLTQAQTNSYFFPGGHFFLNHHYPALVNIINNCIQDFLISKTGTA